MDYMKGSDITSADYTPGNVEVGDFDLKEYYRFDLRQFRFLEEYAKDLDSKRAAKEVGIAKATANNWLSQEKFKAELVAIHDAWRMKLKMNADQSSLKFMNLLEKMEGDYDEMDPSDKAKMAASLARMAETYLKATGKFNDQGPKSAAVQVNISFGSEEPKDVVIEGEAVE